MIQCMWKETIHSTAAAAAGDHGWALLLLTCCCYEPKVSARIAVMGSTENTGVEISGG